MKLVTFAIDTPMGEIRRVGAIGKDGRYVDLAAGREAMLKAQGVPQAYRQAQLDCPSDMLAFIRAGDGSLKKVKSLGHRKQGLSRRSQSEQRS